MAIVLWCFQLFLGHFVFRDRTLPKITITVNNRFVFTPYNLFISRTYQLSKKKRKKTNLQTKQLWHNHGVINIYAVVNFLSQVIFIFLLFLGMLMYANEV